MPGSQAPASNQSAASGSMPGRGEGQSLQHIPATTYIIFSNVPKLEAIGTKLREFSSMLSALPDKAALTLGEADVAPGGSLDTLLARCVSL